MAEEQPKPGAQPPPTPGGSTETERAVPTFEVVRRGFSQEQVLEHLQREGERVHELEVRLATSVNELAEVRQELESARGAPRDPMAGVSSHVLDLVRGFDKEIERQRRMVDLEATGMLADARTEAAKMRMDAQAESDRARGEAERMVADASEEATRIRNELESIRTSTLEQVREMRDRMRGALGELDVVLVDDPEGHPVIVLGEASSGRVPPPPRSGVPPAS
jgi:hypothetical protein